MISPLKLLKPDEQPMADPRSSDRKFLKIMAGSINVSICNVVNTHFITENNGFIKEEKPHVEERLE